VPPPPGAERDERRPRAGEQHQEGGGSAQVVVEDGAVEPGVEAKDPQREGTCRCDPASGRPGGIRGSLHPRRIVARR
jgi:hypothetical protein